MNKIQEQLPELWEKLNPGGRFDAYFARRDQLMTAIASLPPEERWHRLQEFTESRETKAYVKHQAKVLQGFLLQKRWDLVDGFSRLMRESSQRYSSLFPMNAAPPVSYGKEIAGYVSQIIGLYRDALPGEALQKIHLRFDVSVPEDEYDANDELQPIIEMTFHTGVRRVCPGELWNETIELEREGRKNAQTWAEFVWPEFRQDAAPEDIARAAREARDIVAKEYPDVPVTHEIAG